MIVSTGRFVVITSLNIVKARITQIMTRVIAILCIVNVVAILRLIGVCLRIILICRILKNQSWAWLIILIKLIDTNWSSMAILQAHLTLGVNITTTTMASVATATATTTTITIETTNTTWTSAKIRKTLRICLVWHHVTIRAMRGEGFFVCLCVVNRRRIRECLFVCWTCSIMLHELKEEL